MSPRTDRTPRQRLDPATRRAAILAAASQAFADHPYDEVSVAHVAKEVGASEALVHKYFSNKAGLYAAVLAQEASTLAARTADAASALPQGASARDHVRTSILVYLTFIQERAAGWSAYQFLAGREPGPAAKIRSRARQRAVAALAKTVGGSHSVRDEAALWGYLGFLDAICLRWVEVGCPDDHRHSLVDAALGCLEGALGDWRA